MTQTTAASSVAPGLLRISSPARFAAAAVAGSLFVALCSHISIPLFFTPVPMTLQPGAVLLLGLLMEPMTAFAALALFLLEGAAGLPVFTPQGLGGMLQLLSPTGGYLMSYPFAAALVAMVYRVRHNFPMALMAAAAGNVLIWTIGTSWLAHVTQQSFLGALSIAVAPFLIGDALKVCASAAIVSGWKRLRIGAASKL